MRSPDERAPVADEIHDQNAKLYGQLLDHDDGTALVLFGDFGEVDRDLGGGDADAEAVDEAAGDELADTCGGDLEGGADEPEYAGLIVFVRAG